MVLSEIYEICGGIHVSKKDERLNHIMQILQRQNGIAIRELAAILDVSEMTVRRDLEALKNRGIVLDVPGVAVLNPQSTQGADEDSYHLSIATKAHMKEKERIGKYAASLIEQDDCIIIDNGSTVEYLADNIPKDIKITVFTCNLNILNKVCNNPNISVIFGGGYYHPDTSLFECQESIHLIEGIRATKVFASAAGVHDKMGATCMNNYEVNTKQAIIQAGVEKILLVDSSKFGITKPYFQSDLNIFDRVITDEALSDEWTELLREQGIMVEKV